MQCEVGDDAVERPWVEKILPKALHLHFLHPLSGPGRSGGLAGHARLSWLFVRSGAALWDAVRVVAAHGWKQ